MTAIYTAQMAGIDLDELAEEVSSAQNQVDCWAYAKVASMEELRDTHLSRLKEDGGACGGTQFIAHRTVVHWLALIARVCPDRSQEERAGEAACRARRPGRGAADACALTAALLLFTPMPTGVRPALHQRAPPFCRAGAGRAERGGAAGRARARQGQRGAPAAASGGAARGGGPGGAGAGAQGGRCAHRNILEPAHAAEAAPGRTPHHALRRCVRPHSRAPGNWSASSRDTRPPSHVWQRTAGWVAARAALDDEEALREGKLRALREAVKLHQTRLGLRFQHSDGVRSPAGWPPQHCPSAAHSAAAPAAVLPRQQPAADSNNLRAAHAAGA